MEVWALPVRDESDQTDVRLEISLEEIFGEEVPESVPLREAIGQAALDRIRERSSKGRSWDGKGFKGYSKSYKQSPEFQAFGKTGTVNLKLRGDMLSLMDVVDVSKSKIVLGWFDSEESEKAHGHITGNVGVKRDFFNLNKKEIKELKDIFKDEVKRLKDEQSRENELIGGLELAFLKDLLSIGRRDG